MSFEVALSSWPEGTSLESPGRRYAADAAPLCPGLSSFCPLGQDIADSRVSQPRIPDGDSQFLPDECWRFHRSAAWAPQKIQRERNIWNKRRNSIRCHTPSILCHSSARYEFPKLSPEGVPPSLHRWATQFRILEASGGMLDMLRHFIKSKKNLRQRTQRPVTAVETLEVRQMPTGTVLVRLMADGAVTINGDAADNNIEIDARTNGFFITGRDNTQLKIKTPNGTTTHHVAGESIPLFNVPTAGNVVIDMKAGDDTVNFDFESAGGEGSLNVQLTGLFVNMEAGDDTFNLNSYPTVDGLQSLTILDDLIVNFGSGADVFNEQAPNPTLVEQGAIDRLQSISVGRDLKINGEQGADELNLRVHDLTVTGDASIVTGNGADTVNFSNDGHVVFENEWKFDTGAGDDEFNLFLGIGEEQPGTSSLDVKGNLLILTGAGADRVDIEAFVPVVIGTLSKDSETSQFLIDTSRGDDHVSVEAFDLVGGEGNDGGSITVQGDFIAKLGPANDCFLAATQSSISAALQGEPGEIAFEVTNDVSVSGGAGHDVIGLLGTRSDRDVIISGEKGNDSLGAANLVVGRNLEVSAGQGSDDLAAIYVMVNGTTSVDMGKNNDRVAVSHLMLLGTANIALGLGNDQIDVQAVVADPATIINLDGGSDTDTFDLNGLNSLSLITVGFEPNEDITDPNDVNSADINLAVLQAFLDCGLLLVG